MSGVLAPRIEMQCISVSKISPPHRNGPYLQCRSAPLAILLACICWPASRPALAQIDTCPQTVSQAIATASPEHVGMRSGRLAEAMKALRGNDRDIHALVVLRNCNVVVELYAENVTRDHNHALYSVTKSILATLIGVLLKSGRLSSLDVSVADIVAASTKLEADKLEKARRIRLKDVLSMASGLEYLNDPADHPIYGAADRFEFALGPALVHEPGKHYNYSDGDASIAGAVVAAAAGRDLLSYGNQVLFAPLGFKNVEWWFRDKAGRYPRGWGLRLRAVDMANSVNFTCRAVVGWTRPSSTPISSGTPGSLVRQHCIMVCSGGGGRRKTRGSALSISPMGSRGSVSTWCRSMALSLP